MNQEASDKQRELSKFVDREVHYCASMLISELYQHEKHLDDLAPIMSYQPKFGANGSREGTCSRCGAKQTPLDGIDNDYDTCLDCYDPDQIEALEHWIVSDRLADQLEEQDEMVLRDFLGLTLWGRTCSGQAIFLDGVIECIYDKMNQNTK